MKTILSSRRDHYVAIVSIFLIMLITVALIAGMVGCAQPKYTPMVAAGGYHTVGLKADDTMVAVGDNDYTQCEVWGFNIIVQVAAGYHHTVGVKSGGNVLAVGDNSDGQCNVDGWANIIQVAAGECHTVGLKSNGTVVAVGDNYHGQCNVGVWKLK
jgi:alpha-tubulin suppressor-like RCC1 family protein